MLTTDDVRGAAGDFDTALSPEDFDAWLAAEKAAAWAEGYAYLWVAVKAGVGAAPGDNPYRSSTVRLRE